MAALLGTLLLRRGMGCLLLGALLRVVILILTLLALLILAALTLLLRRRSGSLGRRSGSLGRLLRRIGKNSLEPGNLVMLGQVLKHYGQFPLVQVLSGLFGNVEILAQDINDLPGLQAEVLRQLIYFIFVHNTTQ